MHTHRPPAFPSPSLSLPLLSAALLTHYWAWLTPAVLQLLCVTSSGKSSSPKAATLAQRCSQKTTALFPEPCLCVCGMFTSTAVACLSPYSSWEGQGLFCVCCPSYPVPRTVLMPQRTSFKPWLLGERVSRHQPGWTQESRNKAQSRVQNAPNGLTRNLANS